MKVIALKKDNGMVAIIYPCPYARGITLLPGTPEIPAVPAMQEVSQSKTTPYQPATPEIPAIPATPLQILGADGVVIPGLSNIESEDEFIARITSTIPQEQEYVVIDNDYLPNADSDFFDAWAFGKAVIVDLTAAKNIWRDKLRQLRDPVMAALDIAYMRADETGDIEAKAQITAKKQALRDLPNHKSIAAATNTIQLRNAGLDIISANSP